jgi:two-component system cell cycle response regulator
LVTTGHEDAQTQAEVFHAGANDFVNKPFVEEVVMARVRSLLLVKHQYDALRLQTANMEKMATTDALTGTRNRRYLVDEGQLFLNQKDDGWVMIIDLDHFKSINDSHGHLVGDQVLIALGDLLNEHYSDGLCARFGGEEFVIIIHGPDIPARAEAIRQAIEQAQPADIKVTVSIGLATVNDHPGADLNSLLGLADKALYSAKNGGRNRIYVCQSNGVISPLEISED